MSVKILKLVTGEEIICKVSSGSSYYRVEDIASVIFDGQQLGLAPYMPYADTSQPTTISFDHVIFAFDAVDKLTQEYQRMFSQIMTPPSGVSIPPSM